MLSKFDMRGRSGFRIKGEAEELSGGFSVDFEVLKLKIGKGDWARGFFLENYHDRFLI